MNALIDCPLRVQLTTSKESVTVAVASRHVPKSMVMTFDHTITPWGISCSGFNNIILKVSAKVIKSSFGQQIYKPEGMT